MYKHHKTCYNSRVVAPDGYTMYNYTKSRRDVMKNVTHNVWRIIIAFAVVTAALHIGARAAAVEVSANQGNQDQEVVDDAIAPVESQVVRISTTTTEATPPVSLDSPMDLNHYQSLVDEISAKWGVSPTLVNAIIRCENRDLVPNLQSGLTYNFDYPAIGIIKGEREYSFGLVQINLHYNPHVSYVQATDPAFSINFLAENLAAGRHSMWGCYTNGGYLRYI